MPRVDSEIPVRRRTRSPTKKSTREQPSEQTEAVPQSQAQKTEETVKPAVQPMQSPAQPLPAAQSQQSTAGLMPGRGPLPMDFPTLPLALQEMMVRFYRFERYSVPLIRDLETRLLDVERDAQMALHGDTMSANSARDREMDKWVGEMTNLMRHEVGQLKAATKEIREGREIIAAVAKNLGTGRREMSERPALVPIETRQPSASHTGEEQDAVSELPPPSIVSGVTATQGHGDRKTNISSASFKSAIPLQRKAESDAQAQAAAELERKQTLALPPGAAPALDKDEGKSLASPTKSISEAQRERSTSPSGRRRYTSALGEPMDNGRISPSGRHHAEGSDVSASSMFVPQPPPMGRFDGPNRQATASPSLSDAGSNASSTTRARREQSVQDRIRGLVIARMTEQPSTESIREASQAHALPEEEDESNTKEDHDGDIDMDEPLSNVSTAALDLPTEKPNLHLKTPSAISKVSAGSDTTFTPNKPPTLLGGRFSPAADLGERRRSVSPSFVPAEPTNAITTSSRASSGVQARAQAFLQAQEKANGSDATSPIVSPAAWAGGKYGSSPTKRTSMILQETETAPQLQDPSSLLGASTIDRALRNTASFTETRPLTVKKSSSSIGAKSLGANPTSPDMSSPRKSVAGPGKSLKDRVAFFETAH
jgi:hypothetical protein